MQILLHKSLDSTEDCVHAHRKQQSIRWISPCPRHNHDTPNPPPCRKRQPFFGAPRGAGWSCFRRGEMNRKDIRKSIKQSGVVGESKVLRTKHIDTLGVYSPSILDLPTYFPHYSHDTFTQRSVSSFHPPRPRVFQVLSDYSKENDRLAAENRELRERLEELVEKPTAHSHTQTHI